MVSLPWMQILFAIVLSCASVVAFNRHMVSTPQLVMSFAMCNFDFGSDEEKQAAFDSKAFIPEGCFLNKVESYRGCLYSGVPYSLVKVVKDRDGSPILQPFPNRDIHSLGDCKAIQNMLSMTVDTNTAIMWNIDAGHISFPNDDDPFRTSFCPAKLLALNMRNREVVLRYEFPESVVPAETNLFDDFVLDYVKGGLAFIYITDAVSGSIVVYDVKNHVSFNVQHFTMSVDPNSDSHSIPFPYGFPPLEAVVCIDGIAMTCNFRYMKKSS